MKVLITSDCYKPTVNGVVTSIINLKRGLEELGADVRILTLSNDKHTYSKDGVYYIGSVDMGRVYPGARLRTRPGRKEIEEIIDWHPDIIHTQTEFSTYQIAKRLANKLAIPMVHTYHTVYEDYTHYFSPSQTLGRKAVSAFTKKIGRQVDVMIAPTQKTNGILEDYRTSCPVEIIPSGIDLARFHEKISEDILEKMKEDLEIDKEARILLSVSRISKEKNIHELIAYMESVKEKDMVLVIVGDGPERPRLEKLVQDKALSKQVRFTGMIDPKKVANYYKLADVFVSASSSETQGLTYIEALASGTPILCKYDECLDGVLREGKNGYGFDKEASYLVNLEKILCHTSKKSMEKCAIETAEKYSIETFATSVHSLYSRIIRKSKEVLLDNEFIKSDAWLLNLVTITLFLFMAILTIYGYQKGYFTSIEDLQQLVASVGIWGPLVFILSQILQVVFPIIPGGLGCLAGVILFGPVGGFAYNYIGIVLGSFIVFALSKRYGPALIVRLFPRSVANRYLKWTEKKEKFKKWFAIAIFLPVAPDDLLCYIAGTTRMKWKDYTSIILLGKPLSIAAYSLGLYSIFNQFLMINI